MWQDAEINRGAAGCVNGTDDYAAEKRGVMGLGAMCELDDFVGLWKLLRRHGFAESRVLQQNKDKSGPV